MKIRKIKKEFKMGIRPIRKNRSYKVAKRLRKLWSIGPFSDTISYSQDIWQGKAFLPLMLTIRIGKSYTRRIFRPILHFLTKTLSKNQITMKIF